MTTEADRIVRAIHDSPTRLVLAVTGGGAGVIAELCVQPGASRTVLEAVVPYSAASLTEWLSGVPDQACAETTARAMAMRAMQRGRRLAPDDEAPPIGVACTAALVTDRPRRGSHRAHVAVQTIERTITTSLVLEQGLRNRHEEERLVARLVLNMVATGVGLTEQLPLPLQETETLKTEVATASPALRQLIRGERKIVHLPRAREPAATARLMPRDFDINASRCRGLLCGAFNPPHQGHFRMASLASQRLGGEVFLELCVDNCDKPPLDYLEIQRRAALITPHYGVVLTMLPTFDEKSEHLPGITFVVGADTIERVGQCRYYGGCPEQRDGAIARIAARGCRFLVFGRLCGERFLELADLDLPQVLRDICEGISEGKFREDASSTKIREGNQP